jgi:TonB family protein
MGQTATSTTGTPHIKTFVAPAYPAVARKNRIQGATSSEIKVRTDGMVDSVRVTMAHPVFGAYVEKALQQWRFEPIPVATSLKVTVRFWLDGCEKVPAELVGETRVEANLPESVDIRTCPEPVEVITVD